MSAWHRTATGPGGSVPHDGKARDSALPGPPEQRAAPSTCLRAPAARAGVPLTTSHASTMTPMRIFVVEDDTAVRDSLRRALQQEGFTVELAGDGAEALRLLDEREVEPDAIMLDVLMPEVDGLEVCRRLRRRR